MAKDVVITLNVECATLAGYTCPSQQQIDDTCTLSDNNDGSTNGGPEQFESTVFKDKNVEWKGHSYDAGYTVAITGITYEGGTQMFKNPPPCGGDGTNSSEISEKLENNSGFQGDSETYSINFSFSNEYKTWGPYTIDPKLKMSTTN